MRCLQELQPGMYSLAFSAATEAPAAEAGCAAQQSTSLEHQMATAAVEQGAQRNATQHQPASPAECTDMRSRSVGVVVEHPWRDHVISALRAGRTPPLPLATATCPVPDTGPSTASGQLPDGFDAAVTAVLDVLGEAVRVRCQCIDEHEAGPAYGSTRAQHSDEFKGTKHRHGAAFRCSAYCLKPEPYKQHHSQNLLSM